MPSGFAAGPPPQGVMILVDTSVWVDHLRRRDAALGAALDADLVAIHPFVIGELACGSLKPRGQLLGLLRSLARLAAATDDEVLDFLERHRLMGRGLGDIDVHLLAATALHGPMLGRCDQP